MMWLRSHWHHQKRQQKKKVAHHGNEVDEVLLVVDALEDVGLVDDVDDEDVDGVAAEVDAEGEVQVVPIAKVHHAKIKKTKELPRNMMIKIATSMNP